MTLKYWTLMSCLEGFPRVCHRLEQGDIILPFLLSIVTLLCHAWQSLPYDCPHRPHHLFASLQHISWQRFSRTLHLCLLWLLRLLPFCAGIC